MLKARTNEVATSFVDGDATLIHLTTRVYYGLDGLGAAIWAQLLEGTSRQRLIDGLGALFPAEASRFVTDLDQLLAALLAEALIEEIDGEPSTAAPAAALPETYQPPELQRFDDLKDHLALDPPLPLPPTLAV